MNNLKLVLLEERVVFDAAAVAHVIHVNSSSAAGGDGSSWNHAFNNLQDALAAGNSGGAIASAQEGSVSIQSNVFNQNSAANGGSINDVSSTSYVIDSNTFAYNNASSMGREIWPGGLQGSVNGLTNPANIIAQLTQLMLHC